MQNQRLNFVSAILEGIIPVIGYFLWDWNVTFVIIYYLFDFLLQQVLFHLKLKKVVLKPNYFNGEDDELKSIYAKLFAKHIIIGIIALGVLVLTGYQISASTIKGFSIIEESSSFFWYREMGIPQGFLIIPLFIVVGYAFYKMKFLLPKLYIYLDHKKFSNQQFKSIGILIATAAIFLGISYLITIPQWIYIVCFACLKLFYDVFLAEKLYA